MQTFHIEHITDRFHKKPRAIALGIFDGVHLGHRAVIALTGGRQGLVPSVFSFSQAPWQIPKSNAWEIVSETEKQKALVSLGIEEMFLADFEAVRNLSPEEFVKDILQDMLGAEMVCCGYNFHFGKNGSGDARMLQTLCERYGMQVAVAKEVAVDGEAVSSSRIRRYIEAGEMEKATRLLGHPFTVDFTVVTGQQLGRELGTPTINQPLPDHFVRPRFGVYASSVLVGDTVMTGITNVGMRPTVGAEQPLVETWIPSYQGDLYGQQVPVSLVRFIRPEVKFETLDELQQAIFEDEKTVCSLMEGDGHEDIRAVLFDFDDTLHDRNCAYMRFSEFFVKKYFPELSPQEQYARMVEMTERNGGGYVDYLKYLTELIQDWNWKDAPSVEELYSEVQFMFPEYVVLNDEAIQVLKELRSRGLRLGIITNGPILLQHRKLDVCGVRPLVDVAVVSCEENVHKPSPEIFRRAASRLGVPCRNCLFVGDHPINDIQGAQSAGMKPVYINFVGNPVKPQDVPEIISVTEILDMI